MWLKKILHHCLWMRVYNSNDFPLLFIFFILFRFCLVLNCKTKTYFNSLHVHHFKAFFKLQNLIELIGFLLWVFPSEMTYISCCPLVSGMIFFFFFLSGMFFFLKIHSPKLKWKIEEHAAFEKLAKTYFQACSRSDKGGPVFL